MKNKILEFLEYFLLLPSLIVLAVLIIVYTINSLVRIPFLYKETKSWKKSFKLWKGNVIYVVKELTGL